MLETLLEMILRVKLTDYLHWMDFKQQILAIYISAYGKENANDKDGTALMEF